MNMYAKKHDNCPTCRCAEPIAELPLFTTVAEETIAAMQATIDNKDGVINIAAIEFSKKILEIEKLNKVIDECRDACRYTHTAEVVEGVINEHRGKGHD